MIRPPSSVAVIQPIPTYACSKESRRCGASSPTIFPSSPGRNPLRPSGGDGRNDRVRGRKNRARAVVGFAFGQPSGKVAHALFIREPEEI